MGSQVRVVELSHQLAVMEHSCLAERISLDSPGQNTAYSTLLFIPDIPWWAEWMASITSPLSTAGTCCAETKVTESFGSRRRVSMLLGDMDKPTISHHTTPDCNPSKHQGHHIFISETRKCCIAHWHWTHHDQTLIFSDLSFRCGAI